MSRPTSEGTSLLGYIKHAFLLPPNLMVFGGAVMGALFSPMPDAFLALVLGLEGTFLWGLTLHPKFRLAVDARRAAAAREVAAATAPDIGAVVAGLPQRDAERFTRLLQRCRQMRSLAAQVQGAPSIVGELRTSGLDQLLWGFVRLLQHRAALDRLVGTMNAADIRTRITDVTADLERARAAADVRLTASYADRLATAQARLEYLERCTRDLTFVDAELGRIEDKIQALSEMAVNQQNPDALSAEIDAAAASMQATESTIAQLQTASGALATTSGPVPSILDDARTARRPQTT